MSISDERQLFSIQNPPFRLTAGLYMIGGTMFLPYAPVDYIPMPDCWSLNLDTFQWRFEPDLGFPFVDKNQGLAVAITEVNEP